MYRKILLATIALLLLSILLVLFRPYSLNLKPVRVNVQQDASITEVIALLKEKKIISNGFWLNMYARIIGVRRIPAGSYSITSTESVYQLGRRFKKGQQSPVKLILGNERYRLRTPQQLAAKIERFEYTRSDSAQWIRFLQSNDSLRSFGVDTNTVMTRLLPLTYEVYWTDSPRGVYQSFLRAWERFWNTTRSKKAEQLGLTPTQVTILASIVEEETQHGPDRTLIASTYLNRLKIGMRLQADPTAKFGAGDFYTRRVTFKHLRHPSPYNTYLVAGLPPGSICLPSIASIEAVLNAPKTDYLYFVASSKFDGTSVFAKDYNEHLKNAKLYQDELNKRLKKQKKPGS